MHLLSAHYRSEFLATPQLVRFDYAEGKDACEPTLLIKGTALILKYIMRGVALQFVAARVRGDRLLYGLLIFDDATGPTLIWSIMERAEEQQALFRLAEGEICQVFLFNELAINVAWTTIPLNVSSSRLGSLAASAALGKIDHGAMGSAVEQVMLRARAGDAADPELLVVDMPTVTDWRIFKNTLITSQASASHLDQFDLDEGRQQEKLITWLTDNLMPSVSIDQPQVRKGKKLRELTDALLSYPLGTFIFESKALALLNRPTLPDRATLVKNILGHIHKAASQLKGAVRQIKAGAEIMDGAGKVWPVEMTHPIHGVILVPELGLLPEKFGAEIMLDFMEATGGYIHILDPSELLRIVQTTEELVRRSERQTITPMMAFDSRLIARAERCVEAASLNVEIITHFVDR
ncbi:hypothetical protein [Labrys sp. 22185]|uniref:hypothetical protein n=1 Tax=Labrys sp. 22185 TaxID=3453888 RepID=UPI003F846B53